MPKESDIKTIRPSKQYPEDSAHYRRYLALKKYYGGSFNEMFFQAAWSVLGPLGSAVLGAPLDEVQRLSTVGNHFKLALDSEALATASGGNKIVGEDQPSLDTWANDSEGTEDIDDDSLSVSIASDPFG